MSLRTPSGPIVDVVAAAIRDGAGRLLLAQRPAGKHLAGLWEFPGGKREPGESAHEALARELYEELGIDVAASQPLMSLTHHYPGKSVRLQIRGVVDYRGQASGREGQAIDWFTLDAARALPMPAADRPILKLLAVDPRCCIVDSAAEGLVIERVEQAWRSHLEAGGQSLCLLTAGIEGRALEDLVGRCATLARGAGARWLTDAPLDLAMHLQADGVVLDLDHHRHLDARPLPADKVLALRCTDAPDFEHAARLEADLACLAPVRSKGPVRPDIDWAALDEQIKASPLPVLLWGAEPGVLARARDLGAFGVATTDYPLEKSCNQ
jgi:8-oxo-dGTP diphosphatase